MDHHSWRKVGSPVLVQSNTHRTTSTSVLQFGTLAATIHLTVQVGLRLDTFLSLHDRCGTVAYRALSQRRAGQIRHFAEIPAHDEPLGPSGVRPRARRLPLDQAAEETCEHGVLERGAGRTYVEVDD